MLKCLAGLEQPTSGQIEVSGLRKAVYVGKDTARTKGRSVRRLVSDEVAQHLPGQRRYVDHRSRDTPWAVRSSGGVDSL
ncbi:unnamed protein product [Ascophyllum nodosum]